MEDNMYLCKIGAGSDAINTVDVSYQLFCAAGYETNPLAQQTYNYNQTLVLLEQNQMTVQNAYKIMITPYMYRSIS